VTALQDDEDLRLIIAAQASDRAAFGVFYRHCEPVVLAFFGRVGRRRTSELI
jgi:hypothetical protein